MTPLLLTMLNFSKELMMTTTISQLSLVLILGSLRINDLAPDLPFKDKIRALSKQYPQFRMIKLYEEDGKPNGEVMEYNVPLPPAKSNG